MSRSASAPGQTELVTMWLYGTHQPLARLNQRAVDAVDLVVEAARVAQVVSRGVAAPQRRVVGAAVDALASFLVLAICSQVATHTSPHVTTRHNTPHHAQLRAESNSANLNKIAKLCKDVFRTKFSSMVAKKGYHSHS